LTDFIILSLLESTINLKQ